MLVILLLSLLFSPRPSFAISEVNYARTYQQVISTGLKDRLKRASLRVRDGAEIAYATLNTGSRGTVVIVPGRTESVGTFLEMIHDLAERGFSVAILDHRGQGHSSRPVKDSDVGYIESFHDYERDLSEFLEGVVWKRLPAPYFVLADSMGAAISTFYLARHPKAFAAAAFAAPMYRIRTSPFSERMAFWFSGFLRSLGFGANYAPTQNSYNYSARFEDNNFTHSRARFTADLERVANDPRSAVGGPGVNWVYEVLTATQKIPALASKVETPLLIFQAGEDQFVHSDAQSSFCEAVRNCRKVDYPGAYHSLLIESDDVREDLLERVDAFFTVR